MAENAFRPTRQDVEAACKALEREKQLEKTSPILHPASGLPSYGGAEGDYPRAKVEQIATVAREHGKLVDAAEKKEIQSAASRAREMNTAAKNYLAGPNQKGDEDGSR